jgi:hypothetical protein
VRIRRNAGRLAAGLVLAVVAVGCGLPPDGEPPEPLDCDGTADTDANSAPTFALGDTVVSCNNDPDGAGLDIDVFKVATTSSTLAFDCAHVEGSGGVMRAEVLRPEAPPTAPLFEEVQCGAGAEQVISGLDSDGQGADEYFVITRPPAASERLTFQVTAQPDPPNPCDPVFDTDANSAPTFAVGDTVVSCNNDPDGAGLDIDVFQVPSDATVLQFDCALVDGTGAVISVEVLQPESPPVDPLFAETACAGGTEQLIVGLNADGQSPDVYFVTIRHPASSQLVTAGVFLD